MSVPSQTNNVTTKLSRSPSVGWIDAYRLILTFEGKHMTIVRVEDVSKHYDD